MRAVFVAVIFLPVFGVASSSTTYFIAQESKHAIIHGHILVLKDVQPKITWFTDSPVNKGGTLTINEYMHLWHNTSSYFRSNNPGTSLNGIITNSKNGHLTKVTCTATMHYSSYNPITNSMTYHIKDITKLSGALDHQSTAYLSNVTLLIDAIESPN